MNTRQTTILIIDDQAPIRQSMADYLEDLDYRILTAENGRIRLALFDKEKVDLVLVDLRMPEVDGLDVLAQITTKSPVTPLIVVLGTGAIADAIEALHHGTWDYLLKPIQDFSVLIHAVENVLDKARLKRENRQYRQHVEQMVTERTQELQQANKNPSESEQQFRSILDNIRAGIVIVKTSEKEVVYVNPTAAEMTGSTAEEIIGGRCHHVVCSAEEGRCPVLDLGQEVDSFEQMLKTSDGQQISSLKIASQPKNMY